jgi:class 3 adenylate cyclase
VASCSNCGASLPGGARFCPSCAHQVSEDRPSEERKLATVLFADLVGSTELADSQDAERTRALLNRFYDAMASEIADAGGTVEKFIGDAVVAAFGAPAAQEDHADRALHAALAMQSTIQRMFGDALHLRIGVNTGDVVVGQPRVGSSFVTGDAVNVAARLEQAAKPGEILVGERTVSAVRNAFQFEEPVTVAAKGKVEGVPCRRLVCAVREAGPRGVRALHKSFVGREAELAVLQETYARAAGEGRPALVTIVGEPGIGKSRLVREFRDWLRTQSPEPLERVGRCLSYGRGNAYRPLGEIVREHLGLLDSDPPEKVKRRLGRRSMLGLTLGLEAPPDLHPLAARNRLHSAWCEFLGELVTGQPAVLLVEDLHWADEDLLDVLASGLETVSGPLLLVVTARPDFVADHPAWGGDAAVLHLEELSASQSGRLVDELLPTVLPAAARTVVVEQAEGNPLFVEELIRTLIDEGVLRPENGGWAAGDLPDDFRVPDTVQALLAARIDLLDPAAKAALQAASVIGRTFWAGPVQRLVEGGDPNLSLLVERDFIWRQAASSMVGEDEFAFKHALTREVAYASLTKANRLRLHARFAGWLEEAGEGRDEHAPLLAHHYAEAVRPEDVDLAWPDDSDEVGLLRGHAVSWLRRAAGLAVGRYEMKDAVSLLERAVDLESNPEGRAAIWQEIAHAHVLYFDGEAFAAALEEAIALADGDAAAADLYAELAFQTMARAGMWGTPPPSDLVSGWIERTLELAPEAGSARAKALIARCYSDYDKSPEDAAEASRSADRLQEPVLRSLGYDVRALVAFVRDDYQEALDWCRRRVSLAGDLDDPDTEAYTYAAAVNPAVACGEFAEAREYAARQDEVTRSLSPHHRLHGISGVLELEELVGNWGAAVELQRKVESAVADNLATPCVRNARSLLVCALAHAHLGDEEEAHRLEQEAEAHTMSGYGTVLDTPRLQLALHRGDLSAVESLLGEPAVRTTNWFYLSSMAAHLDGLAALGARERVEQESGRALRTRTYLEPFALRALGIVRRDETLIRRAADRFEAFRLDWHAARTRALL